MPEIGAIVRYRVGGLEARNAGIKAGDHPAIVTSTQDNGTLNLMVFFDGLSTEAREWAHRMPDLNSPNPPDHRMSYWH